MRAFAHHDNWIIGSERMVRARSEKHATSKSFSRGCDRPAQARLGGEEENEKRKERAGGDERRNRRVGEEEGGGEEERRRRGEERQRRKRRRRRPGSRKRTALADSKANSNAGRQATGRCGMVLMRCSEESHTIAWTRLLLLQAFLAATAKHP